MNHCSSFGKDCCGEIKLRGRCYCFSKLMLDVRVCFNNSVLLRVLFVSVANPVFLFFTSFKIQSLNESQKITQFVFNLLQSTERYVH